MAAERDGPQSRKASYCLWRLHASQSRRLAALAPDRPMVRRGWRLAALPFAATILPDNWYCLVMAARRLRRACLVEAPAAAAHLTAVDGGSGTGTEWEKDPSHGYERAGESLQLPWVSVLARGERESAPLRATQEQEETA